MKKILMIIFSIFIILITIFAARATDFEISWQGAVTNTAGNYLQLPFNVSFLIWDPVYLYTLHSSTIDGRLFFNGTSGFDTTLTGLNLTYNKEYELNTSVNDSAFDTYSFRSPTGWITGDSIMNGTINTQHINGSVSSHFSCTTAATYTGSQGNYEGMNALCDAACSGHMCTFAEMMATYNDLDVSTLLDWAGEAWVSTGPAKYSPAALPVNDCNGWQHGAAGSFLGNWMLMNSSGGIFKTGHCGNTLKVACCK